MFVFIFLIYLFKYFTRIVWFWNLTLILKKYVSNWLVNDYLWYQRFWPKSLKSSEPSDESFPASNCRLQNWWFELISLSFRKIITVSAMDSSTDNRGSCKHLLSADLLDWHFISQQGWTSMYYVTYLLSLGLIGVVLRIHYSNTIEWQENGFTSENL